MTFAKRLIDVTFQLGQGSFGEDGSDTVKVSGLRTSATITLGTGYVSGELNLRIWGLSLDIMNKLTVLKQDFQNNMSKAANYIQIEAGDESGMSIAFYGGISEARADFGGMPDTSFIVVAYAGILGNLKPVTPLSYRGPIDAALIMKDIAVSMGLTLENSGVSVMLPDTYLPGDANAQMQKVKQAANIQAIVDPVLQVLAIWPINGSRGGSIPLISKDTGMVGYPSFVDNGISVTTLYLPTLAIGAAFKVESQLLGASKEWSSYLIGHDLEAEVPGGRWFTHIEANTFGTTTLGG